ncbi:methyltransferase domain-containing protein [Sediminibacillus dalangtanensis]|uniref:Methyltransferase domain-containing protein n=1 Tax=Sediminibacillus dalangtanensis TaxID=2729421 RepID=A0ABX7VSG7_9BACI|nr:class I SAM-dependent methyltransferase [Sediminibacillus dalangtanensis]QTM99892.1 methyltransferase domain-containing protein [Sediminibacillus dalangtanensis]
MSYVQLALVYDILMEDAPYEEWTAFAEKKFESYAKTIGKVADLGCGTGQITRRLANAGYRMTGIDNSEEMLAYAKRAAEETGQQIQWYHADITELSGFSQFDAAVSFCDVINYITDEQSLREAFANVNRILIPEGLFLFDVHSIEHIEHDMKGETFAEIYDDISYVWLCQPGENQGEVFHDLTFFIQEADQRYQRFDEQHHQRTFSINQYRELLRETGFHVKGVYGDFSDEPLGESPAERIFFVCEKKREV